MNEKDFKDMASRCRLMAGTADPFIKRRLLDLADRYDARAEGRVPRKEVDAVAVALHFIEQDRKRSDKSD